MAVKVRSYLGLERHALSRFLFLLPVTYAAIKLGRTRGLIFLILAVGGMLPRVFLISKYPKDALYETITTAVIGGFIVSWFAAREKVLNMKDTMIQDLELVKTELQKAGERFQEIFEKANDAIWLQDLSGKILNVNEACSRLTGFARENLIDNDAATIFFSERPDEYEKIMKSLLDGKQIKQPYKKIIQCRDGSTADIMLTTSLIGSEDSPIFLHIARDITEEQKLQESLQIYAHQISRAHEEERKRIARELHDDTVQTLVGIARRLDNIITQGIGTRGTEENVLGSMQQQIDDALIRIRNFIQYLRPPTLEYLGLLPALKELKRQAESNSDVLVHLSSSGNEPVMPVDEKLLIYRIVQEAMRNALKYSEAKTINIDVTFDAESLVVKVSDDGKGFIQKTDTDLLRDGKLGLVGMKERAALLQGGLEIATSPGKGSVIILSVP